MTEEERMVERACEAYRAGYEAGEAGHTCCHPGDEALVVRSYHHGHRVGTRLFKGKQEAAMLKGLA